MKATLTFFSWMTLLRPCVTVGDLVVDKKFLDMNTFYREDIKEGARVCPMLS